MTIPLLQDHAHLFKQMGEIIPIPPAQYGRHEVDFINRTYHFATEFAEVGGRRNSKKLNCAGGARGRRSGGLSVSSEQVAYHEASSANPRNEAKHVAARIQARTNRGQRWQKAGASQSNRW